MTAPSGNRSFSLPRIKYSYSSNRRTVTSSADTTASFHSTSSHRTMVSYECSLGSKYALYDGVSRQSNTDTDSKQRYVGYMTLTNSLGIPPVNRAHIYILQSMRATVCCRDGLVHGEDANSFISFDCSSNILL